MNENSEKNKKLEIDNQEMSQKFKHILAQYEEREKQMDRINKQMELVTQLNEAKLQKVNIESLAEKESFLKQASVLEDTVVILKRQLSEALSSEKAFKAQVDLYSSKYGEFTKTFQGYKTDMTKMSKKTFKMEKEMLQWKIKYEKANSMLLDLISEKQIRDEHITKTAKQLFHLQKLCRTLSAEKKAFYGKLVECSIEIPEVKLIQEEEVPIASEVVSVQGADKLDEMMKSRDELKKNLNQLQSELSSAIQIEEEAGVVKKNKSRKSKKTKQAVGDGSKIDEQQLTSEIEPKVVEESDTNSDQIKIELVQEGVINIAEPQIVSVEAAADVPTINEDKAKVDLDKGELVKSDEKFILEAIPAAPADV